MPRSADFDGVYDLIVVGRGAAAAAYLDTADFDQLFPMSKTISVLVVGEIDAWNPRGPRGRSFAENAPNNKINQPWHMIDYLSEPIPRYASGGWEVMVNRDDFSKKTKKIIESIKERNSKLVYSVIPRKILSVENTFLMNAPPTRRPGYAVKATMGSVEQTYFGHNVVLATGAGPHRPPAYVTDFNNSFYGNASGNFKGRVIDMDRFSRIAQTLRTEWDRLGATQKLRVAICGPNAALDTVELAGFHDFKIVCWLVPKGATPIVLGTAHQTHSSGQAASAIEYDGENNVKIIGLNRNPPLSFSNKKNMPPEIKGNSVVDQNFIKGEIKITTNSVNGGTRIDLVDYVVYGLGQDAKIATDYISTKIKDQLVPIFDKNQRFGEGTASVLGFQSENYIWETGKNVQNSLMVVGALSAQVANSVPMTKAKDTVLKDIAEMIDSTRSLLVDDVDTKDFIINATTKSAQYDRRCAWDYFLYEDYEDNKVARYDKTSVDQQMRRVNESLEHDGGFLKTSNLEAYKKLGRRCSALSNLFCSYSSVAKNFDQQMNAIRDKYKNNPDRWNAKFWQSLLDNPSKKMTSSQAGSAQILGILSAMAAINGFAPNFERREQMGQGKSWADVVSANQDDRTALRIAIAVCYPLVPEEKANSVITNLLEMRKRAKDKERDGFGVSPQDMDQFHNELILASTKLHQLNREEVSKL